MPKRAPRPLPPLSLLSLAVALLVGAALFVRRAGAQEATPRGPAVAAPERAQRGADRAEPGALAADAGGSSAGPVATGGDAASEDASSDGAYEDPLGYATTLSEQDIPAGLSPEERAALGTGAVPIHREGRYRSAFAHPRFGPPARARVGLVLNSVRNYDIHTGSFAADFFLSLTADRPMPPLHLTFANGHDVDEQELASTPTFRLYRYRGEFTSTVDLRHYPFDAQDLTIEVEDLRAGVDQVLFEPDQQRTSLDEGFSFVGWNVASIAARAYRHLYPPRFDRDDLYVSRYKFVLGIQRFGTSAAFNVYVPAFIIVLISLMGLFMDYGHMEVRTNSCTPMMAAAVLFHYSLLQSVPATGYLTRADKLMLGVYLSLLLNMLSTWAFFLVSKEHHEDVFRLGRLLVPIATVIAMAIAAVL